MIKHLKLLIKQCLNILSHHQTLLEKAQSIFLDASKIATWSDGETSCLIGIFQMFDKQCLIFWSENGQVLSSDRGFKSHHLQTCQKEWGEWPAPWDSRKIDRASFKEFQPVGQIRRKAHFPYKKVRSVNPFKSLSIYMKKIDAVSCFFGNFNGLQTLFDWGDVVFFLWSYKHRQMRTNLRGYAGMLPRKILEFCV